MKKEGRVLRRVIRLGSSFAVCIPPEFMQDLDEYVWLEMLKDGSIRIFRAEVR